MRHLAALMIVAAMAAGVAAPGIAAGPNSGPGRVRVGVDASIWDSSVATDVPAGIFPIGGSSQLNGEFTTAERYGIQIGLRAQERFQGPLTATTGQSPDVGVYEATANATAGPAAWNYDWHVDLRNAKGVARGKTIADYDLVLETDMFTGPFGFPAPVDLTFGGGLPGNAVLYQSSQNPVFGNTDFDPTAAATYSLRIVLTPKTFNGPPLAVSIEVTTAP